MASAFNIVDAYSPIMDALNPFLFTTPRVINIGTLN